MYLELTKAVWPTGDCDGYFAIQVFRFATLQVDQNLLLNLQSFNMQKVTLKTAYIYVASIPVLLNESGPWVRAFSHSVGIKNGTRSIWTEAREKGPHLPRSPNAKNPFTQPNFIQAVWECLVGRLYWKGHKQ